MNRGDLYRVYKPGGGDPKKHRVFVVVSRQTVIDSRFPTVVCAPVFTHHDGLSTQVAVGADDGLKHASAIHTDELVSLPKTRLTHFIGALSSAKLHALDAALRIALELED